MARQQIISALPVGKADALRVSDFETAVGNQSSGTNNDPSRKEVNEAILNDHIPIGSSPQCGYWLIDSDAEFQEVIDRIDATIAAFKAKRDAIEDGWKRRKRSKLSGTPWPK